MGWQFWIDRGGTFTDVVARSPDGKTLSDKLLSENPDQYDDAAVAGIRRILRLEPNAPFPADQVEAIKMGTTVATNALLERKGEPTALAITQGFADALRIGTQNRPNLFDLNIKKPEMLYSDTVEIEERLFEDGSVETPLNINRTKQDLEFLYAQGYRSIAIIFLHADRYPAHEQQVAEIADAIGFEQISMSHDVIPLMKIIGRGDTTVADAYLSPILRRYVEQVEEKVSGANLLFMQSNGGLTQAQAFRGKDAVLSGPAGGVVGMVGIAQAANVEKVIGFDMGGTSTDVSHFNGEFERTFDSVVAGVRLRAPMMKIHTVAAGGGSICRFDGLRFRVGPESAGAQPGPAAYRQGGPLTITDCNVLLGRIQPHHFPSVFGKRGNQPLDKKAVAKAFTSLAQDVRTTLNHKKSPEEIAEGFLSLAIENMAEAIKTISVQKGYDVSEYTLVSFGGAGGQHACQVADTLGMRTILIHPLSGVLSAYGMGVAELRVLREKTVALPLTNSHSADIRQALDELSDDAYQRLLDQNVSKAEIQVIRSVYVRYSGSDSTLTVPYGPIDKMIRDFEKKHKEQFGFIQEGKALIAETVGVEASGGGTPINEVSISSQSEEIETPSIEHIELFSAGKWCRTPVFQRCEMIVGQTVLGPALIVEDNATTVVEHGWTAEISPLKHLVLSKPNQAAAKSLLTTEADPVKVEIFNSLFMAVAERMGAVLQNTAHSVNIKERLDFSCAVFDAQGALVANAPHMPVHLGSMGESVRAVLAAHGTTMAAGDAYLTNAPYNGGTHLPDVTVVSPVFDPHTDERVFFVASRGHHADIGGISPGSMPPHSKTIDEEGVLFDAMPLVRNGQFLEDQIRAALLTATHPSRNVEQNLADLRAQLAACAKGTSELLSMINEFGLDGVKAYTDHVQNNAEEAVRRVIEKLDSGTFVAPLDNGSQIKVAISIDKASRSATVDFSGTSDQQSNNFNAPAAVCRAAVLYVFRTLVADDIPMNEGCLKPLTLIIPEKSMLNPRPPAAVVAGNVETSQIICDALYGALGKLAASQGTMNNLTFGNDQYQYYETLCGGAGAGPSFDGVSAVQTHMTNSRLTDPEVLEWRYPILIESFKERKGSGGPGQHRGGDGVQRRIRFLEPMSVAILSGRRTTPPFGLAGGQDGSCGQTWVERSDGTTSRLQSSDSAKMKAGDTIVIETPGGGGFGSAKQG
jgi:5-oxoprolinase (ATP-hydrolysing)